MFDVSTIAMEIVERLHMLLRRRLSLIFSKILETAGYLIRELHDFLIVRNPTTNNAMILVREFYDGGAAQPTTPSLNSGVSPELNCCPGPSETYCELGKTRVVQLTKLAHLQQMYSSYITPEDSLGYQTLRRVWYPRLSSAMVWVFEVTHCCFSLFLLHCMCIGESSIFTLCEMSMYFFVWLMITI